MSRASRAALIVLAALGAGLDARADTPRPTETATTTAEGEGSVLAPPRGGHRALILPTLSGELVARPPTLDEKTLRAFSGALTDGAVDVFAWRRFEVVAGEPAEAAFLARGGAERCRSEECAKSVALALGATHLVYSRLTKVKDGSCAAVTALVDLLRPEAGRVVKEEVKPCSADNVLARGLDLGRRLADGPRAPVRVALDLTPRTLPTIDLPDLPNIGEYVTSTVARARRGGMTLERALEIYQSKHMFVFEDDARPDAFFIARNGRVLNECDARRAASAPISQELLEVCEGNNWEWAWIGLPIGILLSAVGAGQLDSGGGFQLALGGAISIGSVVLGGFFNVDAADPQEGLRPSSREELERIVLRSNEDLRDVLDLTEAEVTVAGMRR